MKIIVGLGNPGEKYKNTRHNVGFLFIDNFANKLQNTNFSTNKSNLILKSSLGDYSYILCKPQTFMNLSGKGLIEVLSFFKAQVSDVLLIYDEANIDLGKFKLSFQSNHGGHNGVKNIIESLNTNQFLKLRIGIKTEEKNQKIIEDFVMGEFTLSESNLLFSQETKIFEIIKDFIVGMTAEALMNKYNNS